MSTVKVITDEHGVAGGATEYLTTGEKIRNWYVDNELNRDWLKLLLRITQGQKGHFVTLKDGRVIFVGGACFRRGGHHDAGHYLS